MSRTRKEKPDTELDVDHHRPTLERENELLIEENVRLISELKKAQKKLAFYERGARTASALIGPEKRG